MSLRGCFLVILGCLIWTGQNAIAQTSHGESEVLSCTSSLSEFLQKKLGVRVVKMSLNVLKPTGTLLDYRIPFQEKNSYVIAVCGESSLTDLDVRIYSPEGILLQEDQKVTRKPIIQWAPPTTGVYIVRVVASKGEGNIGLMVMAQ